MAIPWFSPLFRSIACWILVACSATEHNGGQCCHHERQIYVYTSCVLIQYIHYILYTYIYDVYTHIVYYIYICDILFIYNMTLFIYYMLYKWTLCIYIYTYTYVMHSIDLYNTAYIYIYCIIFIYVYIYTQRWQICIHIPIKMCYRSILSVSTQMFNMGQT